MGSKTHAPLTEFQYFHEMLHFVNKILNATISRGIKEPGVFPIEDSYEDDGTIRMDKLIELQWPGISCLIDASGQMQIVKIINNKPIQNDHAPGCVEDAGADILSFLQIK